MSKLMFLDVTIGAHRKQSRSDAMGLGAIVSAPYDACPARNALGNYRFNNRS
jgi:hypothetical protein